MKLDSTVNLNDTIVATLNVSVCHVYEVNI